MENFVNRILRAAKLDAGLYEEVESDRSAMGQAMGVVVLSSVAAGIGSIHYGGPGAIIVATVGALLGWYVWAYLTYLIGTRLLPEPQTHADVNQLLRTTGFSSAPGLIRILGVIPGLTGIVFVAAYVWMLIAMIVAVRQALDYNSTLRTVGVCVIGWIVQALIVIMIFSILGGA